MVLYSEEIKLQAPFNLGSLAVGVLPCGLPDIFLLLLYGTIRYHTFGPMLKKNSGRPRHRRDIWLDGVEAHEGPRNMSQDNRTHWLISTQGQTPPNPRRP